MKNTPMILALTCGLLAITSVRAQTPVCDALAALDPAGEIQASPRADRRAETFALMKSRGFAADAALYATVRDDLAALAPVSNAQNSNLAVEYDLFSFLLIFDDAEAAGEALQGNNADFNCFVALFNVTDSSRFNSTSTVVTIEFGGLINVEQAQVHLKQIEHIRWAEPNGLLNPKPASCFLNDENGQRVYYFATLETQPGLVDQQLVLLQRAATDGTQQTVTEVAAPFADDDPMVADYNDCLASTFSHMRIQHGLTGAWYNVDTPGQGMTFEVIPSTRQLFMAWFAFRSELAQSADDPNHRWYTALGAHRLQQSNAVELPVMLSTGGVLDDPNVSVDDAIVGKANVKFYSCTDAIFTYHINPPFQQNYYRLKRITPVVNCED